MKDKTPTFIHEVANAELKLAAEFIPNQAMLINTFPILEAKDSSEIENIVTTTDKLFQFSDGDYAHADPATKEALQYRRALYEGWQTLAERPINTNMAEAICSQIKDVDMAVRKVPGTALANDRTAEIVSTPPAGEQVLREQLPMIYSRELVDTIFEQPHCRISNLVDAGIAKRQTASEYLKKLASIGVLTEQQVGRERLFIHPKLIQLLTQDKNTVTPYLSPLIDRLR